MSEPDVTLTDFALAVLCAGFAVALLAAAPLFAGLFAALALAALLGALWHGWFSGQSGGRGGALWLGTMLAVGAANLFLWLIAADLIPGLRGPLRAVAFGQFALYAAAAMFLTRSFLLPSAFSLPPTLAVLAGFALTANGLGVAGLALALGAAGLQAAKVGAPRLGLTHNGLYHIIQGAAFSLVFAAAL